MPGINPFPERLPDDKAEAIAAKRTAALKEEAGLFAEWVTPVTAEMIQTATKAHHDRFQAKMEDLEERGQKARARIAEMVTPESLQELDKRRAVLPAGSEFTADFWRRVLTELLESFPLPEK